MKVQHDANIQEGLGHPGPNYYYFFFFLDKIQLEGNRKLQVIIKGLTVLDKFVVGQSVTDNLHKDFSAWGFFSCYLKIFH